MNFSKNPNQYPLYSNMIGIVCFLVIFFLSYPIVTAQRSEQLVTLPPSLTVTPTPSLTITPPPSLTITPTPSLTPKPNGQNLYHPAFHKNHFGSTATLNLQNINDSHATVQLLFYDEDIPYLYDDTIPPKGTLVLSANDLSFLHDGLYSLIVASDREVQSVVSLSRSSGDKLALYRGISLDEVQPINSQGGGYNQYFGPFFKGDKGKESALWLMNGGTSAASFGAAFYELDGSFVTNFEQGSISAGEAFSVPASAISELPSSFTGWVVGSSAEPFVGLLSQISVDNDDLFEFQEHLSFGMTLMDSKSSLNFAAYMPRVFKGFDEGGGARTTTLFVGNADSGTATVMLSYHTNDGTSFLTRKLTLPSAGASIIELSSETELPDNSLWGVTLTSDRSLILSEITTYDSKSTYSSGMYGSRTGTEISLPRLVRESIAYTAFSLQNVGSSSTDVTIQYYDTEGSLVLSQALTLSLNGWERINLAQMSQLGTSFEGSAIISSSNWAIRASVDEYFIGGIPTPTVTLTSTPTPTATPMSTLIPTATPTNTLTPTVPSMGEQKLYLPMIIR